jgi:hypothetical protein
MTSITLQIRLLQRSLAGSLKKIRSVDVLMFIDVLGAQPRERL